MVTSAAARCIHRHAAGGGLCAIVLTIIWRHNIADLIAKPFTSLYDGGSEEPIPKPAYSIAQSKQKKGKYLEAIAEIRQQLDRFPTDVEGQLLLAQIQAEDLKDLPAAELTIERFCAQPGHAPQNIVFALYSLADWHLKIAQDREAAQRDLEKIIELFPESEFALGAAHRIAHLGSAEMLLAPHERKKFIVAEGVQNLGLLRDRDHLKPAEPDPEQVAAECVKHLEQHPQDTEAREKLAVIYADHYRPAGHGDRRTGADDRPAEPAGPAGRALAECAGRPANPQRRRLRGGPADAATDCGSRPEGRSPPRSPATGSPCSSWR